jgi:hypothetical protein
MLKRKSKRGRAEPRQRRRFETTPNIMREEPR